MAAKILIIEDNRANQDLMVYLLGAFGYTVHAVLDGEDGLRAAATDTPDLIVCDLEMPRISGYEVARRLKASAELERVPLLAVSAFAMVGDREKILAAGFDGYISKPIDPQLFIGQIETFLSAGQRSTQAPKVHPASEGQRPSRGKHATILVVDDSAVNLSLIISTLEPSGYVVVATHSSLEAVGLARRHSPDLILSDLHMPRQGGLELLRRIKADPALQSIPFILFSASRGRESEEFREYARSLGAAKFISRPVEPQKLLAEIKEFLESPERD